MMFDKGSKDLYITIINFLLQNKPSIDAGEIWNGLIYYANLNGQRNDIRSAAKFYGHLGEIDRAGKYVRPKIDAEYYFLSYDDKFVFDNQNVIIDGIVLVVRKGLKWSINLFLNNEKLYQVNSLVMDNDTDLVSVDSVERMAGLMKIYLR